MTESHVYLDNNATTPIHPELIAKVTEWLCFWGNPSSIHQHGRGPKRLLRDSRKSLTIFLNCSTTEIIFTSGGSEANNLALISLARGARERDSKRNQIIYTSVEHPSVVATIRYLCESEGFKSQVIPVNREGILNEVEYEKALDSSTALVCCMFANNEVGAIYPIKGLAEKAHIAGAYFHCDGVQAVGKVKFTVTDLGVDSMSFAAHKFYSLKGAGALYLKRGTPFQPLIHGGAQERRRRAGTENVLALAAMGYMLDKIATSDKEIQKMKELRDHLELRLKSEIPNLTINAEKALRLPNTSSVLIPGIDGESLLMSLDIKGYSVSTGAACSSGSPEPSPVLMAMGLTKEEAQSSLRLSLGLLNTKKQVDDFVDQLKQTVSHLRQVSKTTETAYV